MPRQVHTNNLFRRVTVDTIVFAATRTDHTSMVAESVTLGTAMLIITRSTAAAVISVVVNLKPKNVLKFSNLP
jgi:hypothetical protein